MKIYRKPYTNKIRKIIRAGLDEYSNEHIGINAVEKPIIFYCVNEQKNIISAIVVELFLGTMHSNGIRLSYMVKLCINK